MNASSSTPTKPDIRELVAAIADNTGPDSLSRALTPAQWDILATYMHASDLPQGQVLFTQGGLDRALYFLATGHLRVHYADQTGRVRLASVAAGSVVGEGGFFSHLPRRATVQAGGPCRLWSLAPMRFTELTNRQPALALALTLAMGAIVSKRLLDRRTRIAVT